MLFADYFGRRTMRSIVALVIVLAGAPGASAQSGVISPDEKASSEQYAADDRAVDKDTDTPADVRQSICRWSNRRRVPMVCRSSSLHA
jgi:hypothetical protein